MVYRSHRLRIEGTNDDDVATALAYLAGFGEGTIMRHRSRSCGDPSESGRAVIVFHRETVARDPDLFLATQEPDIIVNRLLNDVYIIGFDERVDESLVDGIEEEIKVAYAEAGLNN